MQLHTRKARISHKSRRIHKPPHDAFNIGARHLLRRSPSHTSDDALQNTIAHVHWHSTGRNRLTEKSSPACTAERLTTGMADLCDGRCTVFLGCVGVLFPLCHQSGIFACVLGWQRGVERCAQVVDVNLDVSCVDSSDIGSFAGYEMRKTYRSRYCPIRHRPTARTR